MNSAELGTVRVSRNATTAISANGEVQTHEEATVYVNELDMFLTVQILEDTPAVLSLGNSAKITEIPMCEPVVQILTMQHGELRA